MVSGIIVTPNDITDRRYQALGDIHVTVSKTTVFNSDPTEAKVEEALREKAADLGANAVVFARYGAVTMTLTSYGAMEGAGRAVRFVP
ncbi:hypothetical protein [Acidisphaera sp. L21]|uniref:hypothetical protein n=1 Tax=Acidisphaera sp. L21 TaxID=1641851 RepID=UPI00131BE305|nr:hypothetical protein [Acidisphaera sp. L21]